MPQTRILGAAGLTAWLMVGLPVVIQGATVPGVMLQWAVAYILFGALFIADLRHPRLSFLAMEALCVVVMVLAATGSRGALVLIAMRLPSLVAAAGLLDRRQTSSAARWRSIGTGVGLSSPPLRFQILALSFELLEREMRTNARFGPCRIVADGSRLGNAFASPATTAPSAMPHRADAQPRGRAHAHGGCAWGCGEAQSLARRCWQQRSSPRRTPTTVSTSAALRTLVADLPRRESSSTSTMPSRRRSSMGWSSSAASGGGDDAARHSGAENTDRRPPGSDAFGAARDDGAAAARARRLPDCAACAADREAGGS
jgi:hypothetical protein